MIEYELPNQVYNTILYSLFNMVHRQPSPAKTMNLSDSIIQVASSLYGWTSPAYSTSLCCHGLPGAWACRGKKEPKTTSWRSTGRRQAVNCRGHPGYSYRGDGHVKLQAIYTLLLYWLPPTDPAEITTRVGEYMIHIRKPQNLWVPPWLLKQELPDDQMFTKLPTSAYLSRRAKSWLSVFY